MFIVLTGVFSLLGVFLPANTVLGWDWNHFFSIHRIWNFYPPWTGLITDRLNWPIFTGLGLAAYSVAIFRRSVHPISGIAALITFPLMWSVSLGQLEGLVLVGLLWLPWLAPIALIKPQVAIFAFFSRKSYILAGLVVLLISLIVWGPWPITAIHSLLSQGNFGIKRAENDINLGMLGIPLALVLLWFSTGDMDMLMFAGVTGLPYLLTYHLMPATPTIARLKPWKAILAALLSWLPLSAQWLGPKGWWLGWVFIGWMWLNPASPRYPNSIIHKVLGD